MSHLIDQIVEATRARLVAAGTYAGANVAKYRKWPVAPADGAAFDWLLIGVGQDRVTESTPMRPRRLTEDVEITVRALSRVATASGAPDERAIALMLQVQHAMVGASADVTLGGLAKFLRYAGSDPIDDEMNLDAAGREVSFIVTFQTKETSFEVST